MYIYICILSYIYSVINVAMLDREYGSYIYIYIYSNISNAALDVDIYIYVLF